MNFLTTLFNGGDVVKTVGETLDNLFTSDEEQLEKQHELMKSNREFDLQQSKLIAEQNTAQTEVNKIEAASACLFVAGWRPAIGWIGAIALFYQFVAYPILTWLPMEPPPYIDSGELYPIIMGMLGIAGMRTFDKMMKTDTKSMS
ncbi:MAG: holin family protein [Gammaproteobacteria bacterium]|nr:holin family protein [Gammaproteobacteria bacterium]